MGVLYVTWGIILVGVIVAVRDDLLRHKGIDPIHGGEYVDRSKVKKED